MRYIPKSEEPLFMAEWKRLRKKAGQSLSYSDFRCKKQLNEHLIKEQHYVCCYCGRRIEQFQKEPFGSHNEHLVPEKGINGDFSKQMEYGNIYACCIHSKGQENDKQHCGEAKKDKLIHPFIQKQDCGKYFKYNVLGEIMPNGDYHSWKDYKEKFKELSDIHKEAVNLIETLNLNCHSLKDDRKKTIDALLKKILQFNSIQIQSKVVEFEKSEKYPAYIDTLLYYMKQN